MIGYRDLGYSRAKRTMRITPLMLVEPSNVTAEWAAARLSIPDLSRPDQNGGNERRARSIRTREVGDVLERAVRSML
jgi:hypothetical protein